MAKNNEYKGERLSFFKLFSEKHYKVVIPIIQRNYAQGRTNDDTKEVRTEFLDALYKYLDEARPNRDLDFVYGTLQKDEDDKQVRFIPLDGQQRLTTLFLLHWFLYQISTDKVSKKLFIDNLTNGNKSLFTYETRQSTTDFCDALMGSTIDMNHLELNGEDKASLSVTLQNEPWFFRSWNNDPSVRSMLVMLDAIYEKFNGHAIFFDRLLDIDNPIITFIFMDLKEYKLTDDLYIKMNSRGKPLTKFENFKAKFEQYIKQFDSQHTFTLTFNGQKRDVGLVQYFSFNIDTKWTTMLWQYCKNGKEYRLDSYLENLIRVIITNHYASVVKLPNKSASDETFDVLMGGDESLSFSKYESTNALSCEGVLSVINSLDALYNGCNQIAHYLDDAYKYYFDEDDIFSKVIENSLTRPERMQFYAYTQYLIHHKGNLKGINEWMRVIHNLTHPDNTITDGNNDMARGIKSIDRLLPYAPSLIQYLQSVSSVEGFSKHQSKEECIKAQLILQSDWKNLIEETEKHNYFNGQIGFILEFAGICTAYNEKKNLCWNSIENSAYKMKFQRYAKIAKSVFQLDAKGNKRINDEDYCFERAVLAHGNYLLSKDDLYFNLLSTETVGRNVKRDLSWKRALRIEDDNERMRKAKDLVKATFDDISDPGDIVSSLERLCKADTEDAWRNILISSPDMFNICEKGFIHKDKNEILLLEKWFPNHYHAELFTYHLWLTKFINDKDLGFEKQYKKQKTAYISPYISLNGHLYRQDKYKIEIHTFLNSDGDFGKFEIAFGFENEAKPFLDYPQEVLNVMKQLNFEHSENGNYFILFSNSEETAFRKTIEIAASMSSLNV